MKYIRADSKAGKLIVQSEIGLHNLETLANLGNIANLSSLQTVTTQVNSVKRKYGSQVTSQTGEP